MVLILYRMTKNVYYRIYSREYSSAMSLQKVNFVIMHKILYGDVAKDSSMFSFEQLAILLHLSVKQNLHLADIRNKSLHLVCLYILKARYICKYLTYLLHPCKCSSFLHITVILC